RDRGLYRLLSIPLRDLAFPGVKTCFGEMKCGTEVSSRESAASPLLQQPTPTLLLGRIAPFGSWHGNALLSESMLPTAGRWVHGTVTVELTEAILHGLVQTFAFLGCAPGVRPGCRTKKSRASVK